MEESGALLESGKFKGEAELAEHCPGKLTLLKDCVVIHYAVQTVQFILMLLIITHSVHFLFLITCALNFLYLIT